MTKLSNKEITIELGELDKHTDKVPTKVFSERHKIQQFLTDIINTHMYYKVQPHRRFDIQEFIDQYIFFADGTPANTVKLLIKYYFNKYTVEKIDEEIKNTSASLKELRCTLENLSDSTKAKAIYDNSSQCKEYANILNPDVSRGHRDNTEKCRRNMQALRSFPKGLLSIDSGLKKYEESGMHTKQTLTKISFEDFLKEQLLQCKSDIAEEEESLGLLNKYKPVIAKLSTYLAYLLYSEDIRKGLLSAIKKLKKSLEISIFEPVFLDFTPDGIKLVLRVSYKSRYIIDKINSYISEVLSLYAVQSIPLQFFMVVDSDLTEFRKGLPLASSSNYLLPVNTELKYATLQLSDILSNIRTSLEGTIYADIKIGLLDKVTGKTSSTRKFFNFEYTLSDATKQVTNNTNYVTKDIKQLIASYSGLLKFSIIASKVTKQKKSK